ncbi:MAG: tetratricopeptide repeat protein [Myxococcota bacterium]
MQDLGAFELTGRLAAGGMGQVWNARHRRTGRPVAVKVIGASEHVRSFEHLEQEVRAVARLDHPNIVAVLDQGRDGSGAPYFVMERAIGTLAAQPPTDWAGVRLVLVAVLDALAHSHARGVLHRDLKPSNILVFEPATYKLADFGIAVALHPSEHTSLSGTPAYMAPEMFLGQWRHYGPPTDLYAVGVLAWELVAGRRPFEAQDLAGFQTAHLHHAPPPFHARFDVPHGLEALLLTLLRKDPSRRYQRAVDAAAALVALGDPGEPRAQDPTAAADAPGLAPPPTQTLTLDLGHAVPLPTPAPEGPSAPPPAPIPAEWRQPRRSRWHLADVGLGLYGLRTVPMVDRDHHRDQLWSGLRDAREGASPAFLLTGAAGTGKSRLARWLCERAHEVGGAAVLTARHGVQAGPRDGVLPMLLRFLRADGLDRAPLAKHLDLALSEAHPALRLDLVDAIMPLSGARPPLAPVLVALLRHLAARAPVVVWADDLHLSEETAALVEHVLDAAIPGVVLVATVRHDVPGGPAVQRVLEHGTPAHLHVDGLAGADRQELVTALLGLEESLVHEVSARTDGNPLFAVQLVADWVQREILVPRDAGFALKPGAPTPPPRAVREVWDDRIHDLLHHRPASHRQALWMAAVLGRDVATAEWTGACARAGIDVPAGLPRELEARHLAHVAEGGWTFAHGMLVETVLVQAEPELDALRTHAGLHLCEQARELEDAGQIASADTMLERARPLLAHDARAMTVLQARWGPVKRKLGQPGAALALLEQALGSASGAEAGRIHRALGVTHSDLGDHPKAREHFELARPLLADDPSDTAQLLLELGHSHAAMNEHEDAVRALTSALEALGDRAEPRMRGRALCNLGVVYSDMGDLDRSKDCYERSEALLVHAGDHRTLPMVYTNLAIVMHCLGRPTEVRPLFEKALHKHRENANRRSEGIVLGNLGSLAQAEGRLADARECFEQSIAAARAVRNPRSATACLLNLGSVLDALGEPEAALRTLRESADVAASIDHTLLRARALGELGDTLRRQGRPSEARAELLTAIDLAEQAGDTIGHALSLATLLAVEAELGMPARSEARATIDAVLDRPTEPVQCGLVHCHLSRAAAHTRDLDDARTQVDRASAILERLGMDGSSGLGRAIADARALIALMIRERTETGTSC